MALKKGVGGTRSLAGQGNSQHPHHPPLGVHYSVDPCHDTPFMVGCCLHPCIGFTWFPSVSTIGTIGCAAARNLALLQHRLTALQRAVLSGCDVYQLYPMVEITSLEVTIARKTPETMGREIHRSCYFGVVFWPKATPKNMRISRERWRKP